MGLFSYFSDRRKRESAIPQASDNPIARAGAEAKPVGQPFAPAQPENPFGLNLGAAGAADLGSIFGAIGAAMQSGQAQVVMDADGKPVVMGADGESQIVDLRGAGDAREKILDALRQAGIDPENPGGGGSGGGG